ncbi:unnamed protein product [Heterobilharzia americana]|nr:unnamed protein product [Heterobilharzia americana]
MITNSNYPKMVSERSTSEQRGPNFLARPIRPLPLSGPSRAASAENRRMPVPWGMNNSPQVMNNLSKHQNHPRSSPTSLSSSSALSIDEKSGSVYNLKSFEKFAHMGQPHVIALYNFETGVEGDLEFEVGDIIMLEDVVDESWYKGRSIKTGAVGIFPMNHVEVRIPLSSGLFTDTQPKTPLINPAKSNHTSNTTRTYSNPSFRKKPIPLPKTVNQSAPPSNSTESLNAQTTDYSSAPKTNQSNEVTAAAELHPNPPQVNSLVNNLLPNRAHISSKPILPTPPLPLPPQQQQQQQPKLGCTPPVINSLKPRNQTIISQMAQLLQERGIVSYRSRPMPSGATHLYPGSHPLLVSSAPASTEHPKMPGEVTGDNDDNNNKNNNNAADDDNAKNRKNTTKTGGYHSPLMVETVLSKLLSELNKSPHNGTNSNGLDNTLTNRSKFSLRTKTSKRIDDERRHTAEISSTYDNNNDIYDNNNSNNNVHVTGATNNNISRASNYVKNLSESQIFKGDKKLQENNQSAMKSAAIMQNGRSFSTTTNIQTTNSSDSNDRKRNNESTDDYDNGNNTYIRQAFKVTKPPEKLVTSKVYVNLSPSSSAQKSASSNQLLGLTSDQQSSCYESRNYHHPVNTSSKQDNKCGSISLNDWLLVECKQIGNESTGELDLNVGDILRCIELTSKPDQANINHSSILSASSSTNDQWIKCENWFGVPGLVNISNVRVIDNTNELARFMEQRPRARVLYAFDKETEDDLVLKPGDIIYLFEAIDDNWYYGESASTGNRGMFPATFIQVIKPL